MDDELFTIPKEQYDAMLLKVQLELLQRINKLIDILENNG